MEEKVLSSIGGVGMYGIISICIFFAFFTGMLVWVFCLRRSRLDQWGSLPLEAGETGRVDNKESQSN